MAFPLLLSYFMNLIWLTFLILLFIRSGISAISAHRFFAMKDEIILWLNLIEMIQRFAIPSICIRRCNLCLDSGFIHQNTAAGRLSVADFSL